MKRELGTFERALLVSDRYAPFHIVCVLRLEHAPPAHIVRKALAILQKRHPLLSARLMHEEGRHFFATLVNPPLPFRNLPRWNSDHWRDVVEVELTNRIDAVTGPMFRCTYLYNESRPKAEIVLALSHFIADSASVSYLLHELMTICASLADGFPVSASELPVSPPLESRFPAAFKGWRLTLRKLGYALAQMGDEISYRLKTLGKRTPSVYPGSTRGHILPVSMPEELVEPFAQRARREGLTLHSALSAALLLAVNRHLYNGKRLPMRTISFADLRPFVQPPLSAENLGCYISMMRFSVTVEGGMDFWSLTRNLHRKIHRTLKTGEKFTAASLAEPLMKMLTRIKAFRLGATALNYTGVVSLQNRYGSIKVSGMHGLVSAYDLAPELSSQAYYFNKQLFWDFIYMEEDMDQEKVVAIVEEIKGIMKSVIANTSTSSV